MKDNALCMEEANLYHDNIIMSPVREEHDEEEEEEEEGFDDEQSVLDLAMFESVLPAEQEDPKEEEELAPLPMVVITTTSSASTSTTKRPAPATVVTPMKCPPAKKAKTTKPPPQKQKRPNCLFVNHFGTRLNAQGHAVRVHASVPVLNKSHTSTSTRTSTPARISAEESVSIRTKSTGKDSKKTTPMVTPVTPSPCVPSVVSIVTNKTSEKKTIKSSCLEDIAMEEDDMNPLPIHDEQAPSFPPSSPMSSSPMHPRRIVPSMMPAVHFGGQPFPLLQRRGFFHPAHPAAALPVWHPGQYAIPFSPMMVPFGGPPPPSFHHQQPQPKQEETGKQD